MSTTFMETATRKDNEQQYQADVDPTLDSLQLLLREAGRFQLLTPAEEIELAKRIEKGDLVAKDRMINSNLRLVVANARRYQGQGLALGDLFADENADDPEEAADEYMQSRAVRLALEQLPELERRILELRYGLDGEPHSLEAIGAELGISRERIRRLEGEALDTLAETLGDGDELALSA